MEHLLHYVVLALLEQPSASPADIMPMFLEKAFRQAVVTNTSDE